MNDGKDIEISVKVDTSDVEKSMKDIEKSAERMSKKVDKSADKMEKSFDGVEKQLKDTSKQMANAFKNVNLNSLTNTMNKVKRTVASTMTQVQAQIKKALNFDGKINVKATTEASNGVSKAPVANSMASAGVAGAMIQKQLSQTRSVVKNVASIGNAVSKVSIKLSNMIPANVKTGFKALSDSCKTAFTKISGFVKKATTSVVNFAKEHRETANKVKSANSKMSGSFKALLATMAPFLTIYGVFNLLKTSVTDAMESVETLNMFNTVFGNSASVMNDWINTMNETLGLSKTNTQQYTATIMQMGRAMGLASNDAMAMSQKMAIMAGDISSFFNTDLATAQQDLRSALSGSFETMDKYGIVLRASTVQQYAYANGIAKVGSELTNAQRAMATTMMIEQQLGVANGDLARSINSPANQARIFRSNLESLRVALGKCFLPILTVVLPILNSFVQGLTTTINAIANFISQVFALFGVQVDFGGAVGGMVGGLEGADVSTGDIADNLEDGASSAKQIEKSLMGIDAINNLSSPDSGSSGGSGGSTGGVGGGSINTGAIDNALAETETKFSRWAQKVASALQSVWGALSSGWNSVSDYINGSLDNLKKAFSRLGKAMEDFLIGCWNNGGEELIYNIGRLAGAFTGLALDISGQVVNAVAQLFEHLNPDNNPNTRKFIDAMNEALVAVQDFALSAGGWLETFMANGGQEFLNNIGDIAFIVGTILVKALADGVKLVTDFINSFVGQAIIATFACILEKISGILEEMLGWVRDNQEWLEALGLAVLGAYGAFKLINGAITLFNTVMTICSGVMTIVSGAGTILASVIGFLTSPVGLVVLAIGALIAIGVLLWQNWDWICAKAEELWKGLQTYWNYICTVVTTKCQEIWDKATKIWNSLCETVTSIVETIKTKVSEKFEETKKWVIEKATDIKTGIVDKFTGAKDKTVEIFDNIKNSIKEKIEYARDKVKEAIDKIKGFFDFEWSLPKIKLPHFSISGEFSLNPPKVPSFGISWYRQGGILPAGSNAIFGMNGNNLMAGGEISTGGEAILPLSDLFNEMRGMFDNQNKQLMSRMSTGNSSRIVVPLIVDGKELARATFDSAEELANVGQLNLQWL